ncbi:hypothetical protein FGG08_006666 [Glutinoglossum americanum]|uniref:Uncharacterized protein n=1 Tax=Glutinoglossum americanum TaxID=1670608 RepID=A0A9P8I0T0_9PEZI|nr:hypothetical protein FGG08_006666 [Glutinoglossum americanum]
MKLELRRGVLALKFLSALKAPSVCVTYRVVPSETGNPPTEMIPKPESVNGSSLGEHRLTAITSDGFICQFYSSLVGFPDPAMEAHSKPQTTPSRRERSHSLFSSILARRKSARSDDLEPIEVAPGVMSTDATAIVFELDTRRKKSVSPRKQKDNEVKEKKASRLPVWAAYRAAHEDDGTDDFSKHPARVATTSYFEKRDRRHDEAKMNHLRAEQQADRGRRTRMRDSADYLTVRFANPATGLVSPSVMSDGNTTPSEASQVVEGQRNGRHIEDLKRQQGDIIRRNSSQWNVAQTPILSPIPQSSGTISPTRRGASNPSVDPGDRFVLHMPSAHEPCPFEHPGKTSEQILAYQKGVEAARRRTVGGLVDPSTPPSPRANSPSEERRISPQLGRSPTMIRRKPVGSAASRRSESEDTVIINGARRAASIPVAPNRAPSNPAIKVTNPERTTRNLSSISNKTLSQHRPQNQQPFLGELADGGSTQVTGIPYHSIQRLGAENHLHRRQSRQDIDQSQPPHPPYPSLGHLPEVSISPPDLVSIPTSQRPRGKKTLVPQNLQDVFTTTTPTTITTTTGSLLRTEVTQRHGVTLPPNLSHRECSLGSSATPENCGHQVHTRDSLLVPRAENIDGLIQHDNFPHPRCLVPGLQAQVLYQNIRTSTSTSPRMSPHPTTEKTQHLTRQSGRSQQIESLGNSARDPTPVGASVMNGGLYGMNMDGGREARSDVLDDLRGQSGERLVKAAVLGRCAASIETQSTSHGNRLASTVLSEDQLTEWRGVGRWPQLVSEEAEAKERESMKGGVSTKDDVARKKSPRGEVKGKKRRNSVSESPGDQTNKPGPRSERNLPDWWPIPTVPPAARTILTALLTMLTHIRTVCTPWSPTNQLLTSPEAKMRDYLQVGKAWALAGCYVGILVYVGLVGWGIVGLMGEVGRCLALKGMTGKGGKVKIEG